MTKKEARDIAEILFDGDSIEEDILYLFPKIKNEYESLKKAAKLDDANQQKWEDYQQILRSREWYK